MDNSNETKKNATEEEFAAPRKAAEAGNATATRESGYCREERIGVPQDQGEANELRRRLDEALEAAGYKGAR